MQINVVGGSGFIGTRLCELLSNKTKNGFSITDKAPSSKFPGKVFKADVRSVDELRTAISQDDEVLVNLAAEHRDDVQPASLYYDVNVGGAKNICIVAREKDVKSIIFTSTVAVYGFAPIGTNEAGAIAPFNDYGRTKYEAEKIFKVWQSEAPDERTLVIIRPTVVFGEGNRGNVYNLLRQISSGRFVMIGSGNNRKSMAYVENLAAFLNHAISFSAGVHVFNYIDKPDFTMNRLVGIVNEMLGRREAIRVRLPYLFGYFIGKVFDCIAFISRRSFGVSSIRVKKFCSDSVYDTRVDETNFIAPVAIDQALKKTVQHEFRSSDDLEP